MFFQAQTPLFAFAVSITPDAAGWGCLGQPAQLCRHPPCPWHSWGGPADPCSLEGACQQHPEHRQPIAADSASLSKGVLTIILIFSLLIQLHIHKNIHVFRMAVCLLVSNFLCSAHEACVFLKKISSIQRRAEMWFLFTMP